MAEKVDLEDLAHALIYKKKKQGDDFDYVEAIAGLGHDFDEVLPSLVAYAQGKKEHYDPLVKSAREHLRDLEGDKSDFWSLKLGLEHAEHKKSRMEIEAKFSDNPLYTQLVERRDFYKSESEKDGGVPTFKQGGASFPDESSKQYGHWVTFSGYNERIEALLKGEMYYAERMFLTGKTTEELDAVFEEHSFDIPFEGRGMTESYFTLFIEDS
jgi:hypothetical protein